MTLITTPGRLLCPLREIYPRGNPLVACDIFGAGAVGYILCLPHIFPYEPTDPHVPQGKFGVPDLSRTSHLILRRNLLFLMSYWDILKLVAVLWVSTPLSPQRAMHQPMIVKEPVLHTSQDHIPEYQAIETWRGIRVPPSEFQIDSLV